MARISNLSIELLDKQRHDRKSFDCGVAVLNNYLHRQAAQDVEKHAAVVYVAVINVPSIAGYYTLSQFSIDFVHLPEDMAKRISRYPLVPATLLGRLAVASAWQRQGLGETILLDALRRSLVQSTHIASAGVVVDANDERAVAFYMRYGFSSVLGVENRLILHMKTIQEMFR